MIAAGRAGAFERMRLSVWQAGVRRQLQAIATGRRHHLSLDMDGRRADVASIANEVTRRLPAHSLEVRRLAWAFQRSGIADAAIDDLASRTASSQKSSARLVGALRLDAAVTWVAPLLSSSDRSVSDAAARALGDIGGTRSAEALLAAIQRFGPRRTLITELARAAPDLFLEAALGDAQRKGVATAVAVAAGLRGRQTATRPLMELAVNGNRRERAAACRALGWLRARGALEVLTGALEDRELKVRVSAAKALAALHARAAVPDLQVLLDDRHAQVRRAAQTALRRIAGG